MPSNTSHIIGLYNRHIKDLLNKAVVNNIISSENRKRLLDENILLIQNCKDKTEMKKVYSLLKDRLIALSKLKKTEIIDIPTPEENVQTIQKFMKSRMSRHLIEKQRQNKEYGKYVGTIRKPVKEEVIHKLKYMASPDHRKAFLELEISNMASYTDKRLTEIINFKRQINSNYHSQMNVITENQIDRVRIIKEESSLFNTLNKQYHEDIIIPINELETMSAKEFLDKEYYLKLYKFEGYIQTLKQYSDEFLSNFLQYIEFQEQAIRIYQQETNDMYIQFAFAVSGTHNKEIEQKKKL